MKENGIIETLFRSLEAEDTQTLIDLYCEFPLINDPIAGRLTDDVARYYHAWLTTQINFLEFSLKDIDVGPFNSSAKWSALIMEKKKGCKMRIEGSMFIEVSENGITRQVNTFDFWSFLLLIAGNPRLISRIMQFFRRKHKKEIVNEIRRYLAFRKSRMFVHRSVAKL